MSKVDLKVVLLGKEASGKTSLVERFVHQRFVERTYQATIGAAFANKLVEVDGRSVSLAIWDTAGSERYEAMSRMYYRNARAAVICIDLTDESSFDRAKYWINELSKNEENCRVYLCGTKLDLVKRNADLRRIKQQLVISYGNAINARYFETSSKEGDGVDELFTRIAQDFVKSQQKELSGHFVPTDENRFQIEENKKKSGCCFSS